MLGRVQRGWKVLELLLFRSQGGSRELCGDWEPVEDSAKEGMEHSRNGIVFE